MSLSTEDYLEFCTNEKPTKILKSIAERCWLEAGDIERLNGAVIALFLQGFITKSTHQRYYRFFINCINKKAKLRKRR